MDARTDCSTGMYQTLISLSADLSEKAENRARLAARLGKTKVRWQSSSTGSLFAVSRCQSCRAVIGGSLVSCRAGLLSFQRTLKCDIA